MKSKVFKKKHTSKIKQVLNKRQDQLTIGESIAVSVAMLAAAGLALVAPIAAIGIVETRKEKKQKTETEEKETPTEVIEVAEEV